MDTVFCLERVLLELQEVKNWRNMVNHLGVPKDIVDRIERDYDEVERQKKEAISWWMENRSYTASWKELAIALLKHNYPFLATRVMLRQGSMLIVVWSTQW